MIERIENLSVDISNIIILVDSAVLQTFVKKKLKETFEISRNMTRYVDTAADLKKVKLDTLTPPFGGGRWFVDVDADKIKIKEIITALKTFNRSAVTVYWTANYATYKKLVDDAVVKEQSGYCFTLYLKKFYPEDITYLHKYLVPEDKYLSHDILLYLKKNYTYDVDAVCSLFEKIKSGEEVKTTKDVIRLVGIGGNTISKLVMKLLTVNPKTEKGVKTSFSHLLLLLNDLSYTYSYDKLYHFMKDNLKTILEIKQLQQMGLFSEVRQEIPESGFNADKIRRFSRFYREILEQVNTPRVLNLLLLFEEQTNYDYEVGLINIISTYLGYLLEFNENNPESKEKSTVRRRRR